MLFNNWLARVAASIATVSLGTGMLFLSGCNNDEDCDKCNNECVNCAYETTEYRSIPDHAYSENIDQDHVNPSYGYDYDTDSDTSFRSDRDLDHHGVNINERHDIDMNPGIRSNLDTPAESGSVSNIGLRRNDKLARDTQATMKKTEEAKASVKENADLNKKDVNMNTPAASTETKAEDRSLETNANLNSTDNDKPIDTSAGQSSGEMNPKPEASKSDMK